MTKRAVILHGTSAEPMSGWRPWLKQKFEAEGYDVWVPSLPGNDAPDRETYNNFLLTSDWDFTDNIIVGHSSGAVEILNLLMDDRSPNIRLGVAVSAWNGLLIGEELEPADQFKRLFPEEGFAFKKIHSKCKNFVFIHNESDPYCSPADAKYLSQQLNAELVMLNEHYGGNADHLGSPLIELPELWEVITRYD